MGVVCKSKNRESVEWNDVKFTPKPECQGLYLHNYLNVQDKMEADKPNAPHYLQTLVVKDLWFILYFVMKIEAAHCPFVIQACHDVQFGAPSNTLEVYARGHWKSTIVTIAETIQDLMENPNETVCILSYNRSLAQKFLKTIANIFEQSEFLRFLFPWIIPAEPSKEAFRWSEDAGLFLKRSGFQKEGSVEAWGLIDGMPTGSHFSKLIYDDVETERNITTPEMRQDIIEKFELSKSIGSDGGRRRVIGTFYHHESLLTYLRDLRDPVTDNLIFETRIKPATDNGEPNGVPVLFSPERFSEVRAGDPYVFACQYLCNPTPLSDQKLNPNFLIDVEPSKIPKNLFRFMTIDPAGLDKDKGKKSDAWAILTFGVVPHRDDAGASDIYIIDLFIDTLNEESAPLKIVDMYLKGGLIRKVGVEKVGASTAEIHVKNALRAKGKILSTDNGSLEILRPQGRDKAGRIASNLCWPLNNGKIFISTGIDPKYKARLCDEMKKFPHWHDDGLDVLAYAYDLIKGYSFGAYPQAEQKDSAYDAYAKEFDRVWNEGTAKLGWMTC